MIRLPGECGACGMGGTRRIRSLKIRKSMKKRSSTKKQGPIKKRSSRRYKRFLKGGAYEDVASFSGSTATNAPNMYQFNKLAGGVEDPSSSVNTLSTRFN